MGRAETGMETARPEVAGPPKAPVGPVAARVVLQGGGQDNIFPGLQWNERVCKGLKKRAIDVFLRCKFLLAPA
jgi:hypothetical protein